LNLNDHKCIITKDKLKLWNCSYDGYTKVFNKAITIPFTF